MPELRRICVFCGASPGRDPAFAALASRVGAGLAARGIGVVYGGGRVGLMGALADAALAAGGEVIGVIPQSLVDRELAHPGLTELHVVDTLHARKATMASLADAFIALPGGLGTLEELAEVTSWAQLDLHAKPSGFSTTGATGRHCWPGWTRPARRASWRRPTVGSCSARRISGSCWPGSKRGRGFQVARRWRSTRQAEAGATG